MAEGAGRAVPRRRRGLGLRCMVWWRIPSQSDFRFFSAVGIYLSIRILQHRGWHAFEECSVGLLSFLCLD